jgi:hypothetical protein
MTLFEWLAAVCGQLGWSVMRSHEMLDEPRWMELYDSGATPAQAAEHARTQHWV